jgi:hypothetical protein
MLALMVMVIMAMSLPAAFAAGPQGENGAFVVGCTGNWSGSLTNGKVTFHPDGRIATPGQGGDHANGHGGVVWTKPGNAGCQLAGDMVVGPPGIFDGI